MRIVCIPVVRRELMVTPMGIVGTGPILKPQGLLDRRKASDIRMPPTDWTLRRTRRTSAPRGRVLLSAVL